MPAEPAKTLVDSPRAFDCVIAAAALFLSVPLLALTAAAIKLTSGGPVLFRAQRVGKNGQVFAAFKFRTMIESAAGPPITAAGDKRVTPIGRWLRRLKIDELPQLWNVVRGEMALVGPRPEVPCYVAQYTSDQRRILGIRPGITSPASVRYRDEESRLVGEEWERLYVTTILPDKLDTDLRYFSARSVRSDLGILGQTVASILS